MNNKIIEPSGSGDGSLFNNIEELVNYFSKFDTGFNPIEFKNELKSAIEKLIQPQPTPEAKSREEMDDKKKSMKQMCIEQTTTRPMPMANIYNVMEKWAKQENAALREEIERLKGERDEAVDALKPLAELCLTGVRGEVVYQRNKTQITVTDVTKAHSIIKNLTGN